MSFISKQELREELVRARVASKRREDEVADLVRLHDEFTRQTAVALGVVAAYQRKIPERTRYGLSAEFTTPASTEFDAASFRADVEVLAAERTRARDLKRLRRAIKEAGS